MEEIGKALKVIFDKLSDFFDIFDLSFLVSGIATTLAMIFWADQRNFINIELVKIQSSTIFLFVIICYINGLVSFAAGRWIRSLLIGLWLWVTRQPQRKEYFYIELMEILSAHGLSDHDVLKPYLLKVKEKGLWRLYIRLWAVIRDSDKYTNSLSLVRRYWVMAATYDGLSMTLFISFIFYLDLCIGIAGKGFSTYQNLGIFITGGAFFLFSFLACVREAGRYVLYQAEEVIATIAAGGE